MGLRQVLLLLLTRLKKILVPLLLMMLAQIFLMLVLTQLPSLRLQTHPPQRLHQHLHLPCLHAWLTCSSLEP